MVTRNITKSLAGMEDLAQGVGVEQQARGDSIVNIGRIDIPYSVSSIEQMSALDVTKFTKARVYSGVTVVNDYIYDALAVEGQPSTGIGKWVVDTNSLAEIIKTKAKRVNTIANLATLDMQNVEAVIVASWHNILILAGGGTLIKDIGRHDGGTFFDPTRPIPTDWTNETQKDAYFADSGVDVVGFRRIKTDGIDSDISWFGAIRDSATYNSNASCAAASKHLSSLGGGVLNIPKGEYELLYETINTSGTGRYYISSPKPFDFEGEPRLITIKGNGSKFKAKSGLHFGSFDPVTGEVYNPTLPFTNSNYIAGLASMIEATNCRLKVQDLELDGNVSTLIVGGQYGDTGIQIGAYGIAVYQMLYYETDNVYSHHHGLDGLSISWAGANEETPKYPHILKNTKSVYNSRQALSWVGGMSLYCENCDFSHTAKNGYVSSSPRAGVDMEAESAIIRNATFVNCNIVDNAGVGLLAVGDVKGVTVIGGRIIGTTAYSTWLPARDVKFQDTLILGACINVESGTKYTRCKLSMDVSDSEFPVIYGTRHDMLALSPQPEEFVVLDNCELTADESHHLPITSSDKTLIINSKLTSKNTTGIFYTRAVFTGHNTITHSSTFDSTGSIVIGKTTINGSVATELDMPQSSYTLRANDSGSGRNVRIVSHYSPTVWAASIGGAIRGDVVFNPNVSTDGTAGWMCTTAGNPGTWDSWSLT